MLPRCWMPSEMPARTTWRPAEKKKPEESRRRRSDALSRKRMKSSSSGGFIVPDVCRRPAPTFTRCFSQPPLRADQSRSSTRRMDDSVPASAPDLSTDRTHWVSGTRQFRSRVSAGTLREGRGPARPAGKGASQRSSDPLAGSSGSNRHPLLARSGANGSTLSAPGNDQQRIPGPAWNRISRGGAGALRE